jgi:hypothetical protein
MSKKGADKKSRSRNLKGLSVFEDEIAAPADYGDFMKIDAPVALRSNTSDVAEVDQLEPPKAPHWEQFIGADGSIPKEAIVEVIQPHVNKVEIIELVAPIQNVVEAVAESNPVAVRVQSKIVAPLIVADPEVNNGDKRETVESKADIPQSNTETRSTPKPRKSVEITPMKSLGTFGGEGIDPFHRIGFGSLVGVQRKIILFIYNECFHHGSLESPPVTREYLAQAISVPYLSMKKSILRLEEKGFLARMGYRRGRGGFSVYKLSKDIYQELTRLREQGSLPSLNDSEVLRIVPDSDLKNKSAAENTKSSSNEIQSPGELSGEWAIINFEQLVEVGFSKYHLKQISQQAKFSPVEVQDFINFFAFDLNRNNKGKEIKGDPINYFMGIIRKGVPYVPPKNYMSPADEARLQYLKYVESRERERAEQEIKIKEFEFRNWKATADLTEILRNAPEYVRGKAGPILDVYLDDCFDKEVWPKIIISKTSTECESEIRNQVKESLGQNA